MPTACGPTLLLLALAPACVHAALPRRALLQGATAGTLFSRGAALGTAASVAHAASAETGKQARLSPSEIAAIVQKDMTENQFLVTGKLTRSIYDEAATFKDEIDTCALSRPRGLPRTAALKDMLDASHATAAPSDTLDKWIKGTGALFVGPPKSFTEVVGDVSASDSEIRFRFNEVLCFNIPLNPKIPLTGEVILTRGENGLITRYLEVWDTNLAETLKKTYF